MFGNIHCLTSLGYYRHVICLDVDGLQLNKFSEWVQIFQKNLFWGEPILGGSKLNVTYT